jgi:hypothetical protein
VRTLAAIVATVVVVGGVLAVILIDGDSDQREFGRVFRQELTATDRTEARRLVSESAELRQILGGRQHAVKSVGVWNGYVLKRDPDLLDFMTVVQVRVARPTTVRAQWPYIGELRPCRRHWVPLTVRNLREVSVYVDRSQSLVAAIVPSRSSGLDDWAVPARRDSSCT